MTNSRYVGSELEIFASATRWRSYWAEMVRPRLGTRILEVGAGIGSVTGVFSNSDNFWTALEPDPEMVRKVKNQMLPPRTRVICGTLDNLDESAAFDTVLYIDVLEHIDDDQNEIEKAAALLLPGGRIIVLAPAHNFLFSPFDTEVGHFRRYTRKSLGALRPAKFSEEISIYLDTLGVMASVANKLLLRQERPTESQVLFWDRYLIPISRIIDSLLHYRVGKSVLVVWVKPLAGLKT